MNKDDASHADQPKYSIVDCECIALTGLALHDCPKCGGEGLRSETLEEYSKRLFKVHTGQDLK